MQSFRVDSIQKLSEELNKLDTNIDNDKERFKEMYKFTFDYAKEPTHKSLDVESAIGYWEILFKNKQATFGKLKNNQIK